jgi:hypothetical protein
MRGPLKRWSLIVPAAAVLALGGGRTGFSSAELQQLLAFYDTPVGRHLAEQSAAIDTDSMKAAQLWGVGVAGDVMKELAAKGVVPD